ncbi:MAG: tyrosine phosphatase family protein [Methylovirgula sp.]
MSKIHVCSIFKIADIAAASGARSLVTLINRDIIVHRPEAITPDRHLFVAISDITIETEGHTLPGEAHVASLLEFVKLWDREHPLLIHCFAGVSRSTAAAFISACALRPDRDEAEFAQAIRQASPTATPNSRLVAVADTMLGRNGRMIAAVEKIGRGEDCVEGVPFAIDVF